MLELWAKFVDMGLGSFVRCVRGTILGIGCM